MILWNFVSLLAPYFASDLVTMWYYPVIALAFVATVPCILKFIWR